jgi:hypothetical protein
MARCSASACGAPPCRASSAPLLGLHLSAATRPERNAAAVLAPTAPLQLVASVAPQGSCPTRSFLQAASPRDCNNNGTIIGPGGRWFLEPAPRVAGQPAVHGQFYIRVAVRGCRWLGQLPSLLCCAPRLACRVGSPAGPAALASAAAPPKHIQSFCLRRPPPQRCVS